MTYGIVLEDAADGDVGAYLPDVPGVGVVGSNRVEAIQMLDLALRWHIEAMIEDGEPLPIPTTRQYEWYLILANTFVQHIPVELQPFIATPNNSTPFWIEHRPVQSVENLATTA